MPRLTKIYTRPGDQGETALITGSRMPKDCLRVRALGTIDGLNAHLGMASSMGLTPMLAALLSEIQQGLLNPGAALVAPERSHSAADSECGCNAGTATGVDHRQSG